MSACGKCKLPHPFIGGKCPNKGTPEERAAAKRAIEAWGEYDRRLRDRRAAQGASR